MDLPSSAQPLSPEIEFLYNLRSGRTRLGLDSTRDLLRRLGSPEKDLRIVQVAGTNGKGTTTALAASLLRATGLRVGRFTSPHLLRVEERLSIDGVFIDPEDFRQRVRDMRPHIEAAGATFFESITAMAAMHFRDHDVQAAVFEVGLGGRLDSTTALPAQASIVTGVSWDHESILGDSLRAILNEKLGIVRDGVPVFTGLREPELVEQATEHCKAHQAPLQVLPDDAVDVQSLHPTEGMRFQLRDTPGTWRCRFLGEHQARNAALALAATRHLVGADANVDPQCWQDGMQEAFLPGRFQVLPCKGAAPETVIDVAHNQQSLHATLDLAQRFFGSRRPTIVLGMMKEKRIDGVLQRLPGWARRLVLTAPAVGRAWDVEAEQQAVAAVVGDRLPIDVVSAVDAAVRQTQTADEDLVLVLGSHYLVAEALPAVAQARGLRPEALVRAPAVGVG